MRVKLKWRKKILGPYIHIKPPKRVAAILTIVYLLYQYWDVLVKGRDDDVPRRRASRVSRSRSRHATSASRSRSRYSKDKKRIRSCSRSRTRPSYGFQLADSNRYNPGRRGRKMYRRNDDCGVREFDQ